MRRYGLRDDQWDRIKELLPGRDGHVGVTAKDNRRFVEAVLYRYRASIPWRDLPERFGDWKQVHTRHSRWAKVEFGNESSRLWQPTRISALRGMDSLSIPTRRASSISATTDQMEPTIRKRMVSVH